MQSSREPPLAAQLALSIGLIFLAKWGPVPFRASARLVLATLLALKIGAGMPAAWRRVANRRRSGAPWYQACTQLFPDSFRSMLRVELSIYLEALCVLTRRALPSARRMAWVPPEGIRYTLHKGSISSIFLPLVILSSLVELPLLHVLIHARAPEAIRLSLHMALLGTTLWGLLWALGDRSAVKQVAHVMLGDEVTLNVGLRSRGRLPLAAVERARIVKGRPREWRQALGIDKQDVVILTPMDPPNVLIDLSDERHGVRISKFGVDIDSPRYLAIYVDQAAAFQRDILKTKRHEI
jgi:hypothetical protein